MGHDEVSICSRERCPGVSRIRLCSFELRCRFLEAIDDDRDLERLLVREVRVERQCADIQLVSHPPHVNALGPSLSNSPRATRTICRARTVSESDTGSDRLLGPILDRRIHSLKRRQCPPVEAARD
jgi:hypothetical protein